jgi:hypothetical protein
LTYYLSLVSWPYPQAKWDEKAEHWIVNDLGKEGSNVNGWHWQEKNKLPWSKQRIDELVKGLSTQLDASIGSAEIKGVKDVTGEVGTLQSQSGRPFQLQTMIVSCYKRGVAEC